MSLRRRVLMAGCLVMSLSLAACQHCCKKQNYDRPIGSPPPGALIIGQPLPVSPNGAPPQGQPGPFMGSPGDPNGGLPPQSLPPSNYYAPPPPRAQPEILMPQPIQPSANPATPSKRPNNAYIGGLYFGEPQPRQQVAAAPPTISESRERVAQSSPLNRLPPPPAAAVPPGDRLPSQSPALPVGIPDFVQVKDGLSSGQRPDEDGMQWLSDNGYRAVVFLRRASEDDSADRKWFEQKGITYHSLVISADRLNADLANQFNTIVGNANNRPVFVYDTSGPLAGTMWYLNLRMIDRLPADEARARAGRLGLSDQGSDEQNQLWTAAQQLLQGN